MDTITYDSAPYAIRDDLAAAHEQAWTWLAAPGTWLTGAQHVAVAAEIRQAHKCKLCDERKAALSPYSVTGEHDHTGELTPAQVEAIHRIATDPGRLTETWLQGLFNDGLEEGTYVEIAGICAMVEMVDAFARGLGVPEFTLPAPQGGAPTPYRPPNAKKDVAWVALVDPQDVVESDGALYPSPRRAFVQMALSSVPDSKRAYWSLAEAHYLPGHQMGDWATEFRAISRPQIEILAARVSSLHGCFY